jgi:hypothetical protein
MWRSALELGSVVNSFADFTELGELFSLRTFWRYAFYPKGYRASDEWDSVLTLTDYGDRALHEFKSELEGITSADVNLALFKYFYHHDLLINFRKTKPELIRQILERELIQETIRLPNRFGRALYDRYNDTYSGNRTDHVMAPDAERLLQGTPIGIYQVGNLLSGPLGIVRSQTARYLPPTLILPLWHCSDTGCSSLHEVTLILPSVPSVDAGERIKKAMFRSEGPRSEWLLPLITRLLPDCPRRFVDFPAFIIDCIVGSDRTSVLTPALTSPHGIQLREALAGPPRKKRDGEGPAAEVAARQDPVAQTQLLLMLSNDDLITAIDDSVFSRAIKVPLGETRELQYATPRHESDAGSELSALGMRSVTEDPIVNLTSAIWRAYQNSGLTNELEWRVRGDATKSPYEALVTFVRNHGPAESVHELILSSGKITEYLCEKLRIPFKFASGTDSLAIDRLLWKLGFNPMQFDENITRYKTRLAELNQTVLAATPIDTEDARERVRGAGVNLFVSLEDFLDQFLSYNIWLLSSDHFLNTHFRFSRPDARQVVAQVLGDSPQANGVTFVWNPAGENSLGSLMRYLRAAVEWVQGLTLKDRQTIERPASDLPHFADNESLKFPFRHTALWADADPLELQRHAELFGRIVKLIEESEPSSVRNGLDHFRESDRFPSADKLLACVARLGQALELADVHRLLPKVFWLFGEKKNRFNAGEYEFRDYAGRVVILYSPFLASGLPPIKFDNACLIAPGNLLGSPNSPLVFQLRERSEFSDYWRDYPKRRQFVIQEGASELSLEITEGQNVTSSEEATSDHQVSHGANGSQQHS